MTIAEFAEEIKPLKAAFGMFQRDNASEQVRVWYDSFKKYDPMTFNTAVRKYLSIGQRPPYPADIINLIPSSRYDPMQKEIPIRFEDVPQPDGRVLRQRVYVCPKCKDTGLITYTDKDGYEIGRVCQCSAGHINFRWGWLTKEEQEEYVRKNGHHGEVIGENWYENEKGFVAEDENVPF